MHLARVHVNFSGLLTFSNFMSAAPVDEPKFKAYHRPCSLSSNVLVSTDPPAASSGQHFSRHVSFTPMSKRQKVFDPVRLHVVNNTEGPFFP